MLRRAPPTMLACNFTRASAYRPPSSRAPLSIRARYCRLLRFFTYHYIFRVTCLFSAQSFSNIAMMFGRWHGWPRPSEIGLFRSPLSLQSSRRHHFYAISFSARCKSTDNDNATATAAGVGGLIGLLLRLRSFRRAARISARQLFTIYFTRHAATLISLRRDDINTLPSRLISARSPCAITSFRWPRARESSHSISASSRPYSLPLKPQMGAYHKQIPG